MIEHAGWPLLPVRLAPEMMENEVHLWCACLDGVAADDFTRILSPEELDRAARFRFDIHRARFVAAHGFLRVILGQYLQVEVHRLRFCYGAFGKPGLTSEFSRARLCFNLSHSQNLALYAVARDLEVGVDIEKMRAEFAEEQTATNFFSPGEVAALRALPRAAWVEGFYNCWTRKEAYVKARGEGLSARLDQFDVSVTPGEPVRLLRTFPDPQEAGRWTLQSFCPQPGFVAAVAVESRKRQIVCRSWTIKIEGREK
jgi:4'-phosphopantetheinyl transferase